MMAEIAPTTRLIDLTVGELVTILSRANKALKSEKETPTRYVYGIAGIASIFNVSYTTALRIKKSGVIDGAITQRGRTILVDTEKAVKLFSKH